MVIDGKQYETEYRPWFAWRPVRLYGPDEWDRNKALNCESRLVWLRWISRMRTKPRTYYAAPKQP